MSARIVLVEGNPDHAILLERAFRDLGRDGELAAILRDAEGAAEHLFGSADGRPAPTLLLLDLDLPGDDGFGLLRRIRRSRALGTLPVVVQSAGDDEILIRRAYEAGANSFIVKPGDAAEALEAYGKLLAYWTGANVGPEIPRPAPAAPRRVRRVLLVEDDPAMLGALSAAVEDRGHEVVRARDGREALERLKSDLGIRLVVLDAVLPVMDGWALRDAMKADPRMAAIPVIVITAYEDRVRARPIDSAAFFAKPFPVEDFLTSIERLGA